MFFNQQVNPNTLDVPRTFELFKMENITQKEIVRVYSNNNKQKITLNALGTKFQITKDVFEKTSSRTRLGILKNYEKMDTEKILSYCDDFDPVAVEFFFNRDPEILKLVLNKTLTGELHLSTNLCEMYLNSELDYWKLENETIHHCCINNFEENYDKKNELMESERKVIEKLENRDNEKLTLRMNLWYTLNKPLHSIYSVVSNKILEAYSSLLIGPFFSRFILWFQV